MVPEYRFPLKRKRGFLHIGTSVSYLRNWGVKPSGILIISLAVELAAIAAFTLMFREVGTERQYELEFFWSYKAWIFGKNVALGMEILNNILLFFPLGFVITDALKRCPFWAVLLISGCVSGIVEFSQYYFRLGLFEFDDIFNNVLGALIGWSVFHILQQIRGQLN